MPLTRRVSRLRCPSLRSRNHPDHAPDDELLESARQIHLTRDNTFVVRPWREIMTKAHADQNAKAMKAAAKKIVPVPKHVPNTSTQDARSGTQVAASGVGQSDTVDAQPSEEDMQAIHAGRRATDPVIGHVQHGKILAQGDYTGEKSVVESGFSIFNQRAGAPQMTDAKNTTHSSDKPETKLSPDAQAKADAAVKAAADKVAKKEAAAKLKAEQTAAAQAARAERAKTAADNKAARDARAAELTAAGRTYVGSMTQLADRVKAGAYVKSLTGQLRSQDDLAVALDAVPAANVVILGLAVLGLAENPYTALNIGQQSMNLRNRMRGAIKKGTLTLEAVKDYRDQHGLATAEAEVAKKKEAQAEREAKKVADKAVKDAAAAKAADAKKSVEAKASANTAETAKEIPPVVKASPSARKKAEATAK